METAKRRNFGRAATAALLIAALVCLLVVTLTSNQARPSMCFPLRFTGQFSTDRGATWQPLTEDTRVSPHGELWVRGHFEDELPEGTRLYYYRDHIGVVICQNGAQIAIDSATMAIQGSGMPRAVCGRGWDYILSPGITPEDEIEFRLTTPHTWLTQDVFHEFLSLLYTQNGGSYLLEVSLQKYSVLPAVIGALLVLSSLLLLGASIASRLLRIPSRGRLFSDGMTLLFSGGFFLLDIISLSFWINQVAFNTCARQLCMMLGVYFLQRSVSLLFYRYRRVVRIAVSASACGTGLLIVLTCFGVLTPYNTTPFWCVMQLALCPLLLVCALLELRCSGADKMRLIAAALLCGTLMADIFGLGRIFYSSGTCTKLMLVIVFVFQSAQTIGSVVLDHQATQRADALEKDLEDSRISVMLAQLQPHFLYNVLNSIYYLCKRDPDVARDMVDKFSDYLRDNMAALEETGLIPFTKEYQHIQTYLSLEHIRFRELLNVVYDIEYTEFSLPPLTVQPLVENAVRHGVTKNPDGGTVTVSTREIGDTVVITVSDTGAGFDPAHYMDDGKVHIGLRNVRKRLESMAGGTLRVTSTIGEGTTAVITLPKHT